jgi:hypothetical protein
MVAEPETGAKVRVFHRAHLREMSAEALGKLAVRMLLEAGAGPLIEAAEGRAAR